MITFRRVLFIFLVWLCSLAPVRATDRLLTPGVHQRALSAGAYCVVVPPFYKAAWPAPLVLISARVGKGRETLQKSGWEKKAQAVGAIAAAIEGGDAAHWQASLNDLERMLPIDAARRFAVLTAADAAALSSMREQLAAAIVIGGDGKLSGVPATLPLGRSDVAAEWAFLERHPRFMGEPTTTRLIVEIQGLRSEAGQILAALYQGPDGFPNNDAKALRKGVVRIKDGAATLMFDHLPPADYAVSILHDENDNGKVDTGLFGIPKEGFGFSANPKLRYGTPPFKEASFSLAGDKTEQRIVIHLKYLSGKGATRE